MVDLEKHYLNILYRMDMMIDAAKCGKAVIAGDINKFGGRGWSRCYYIFINSYTSLKTGMNLAQNVMAKNGELCAGADATLPFIHGYGSKWDLIGRPSFDEFKAWFYGPWLSLFNSEEFRRAQVESWDANGLRSAGYNNRIVARSVDELD
jgi:hypothetical protein